MVASRKGEIWETHTQEIIADPVYSVLSECLDDCSEKVEETPFKQGLGKCIWALKTWLELGKDEYGRLTLTQGKGTARGNNTMMQEGIGKGTASEKGSRRFSISQGVPLILSQGVGTSVRKPRRNFEDAGDTTYLYSFVLCRLSIKATTVPFSCLRGWGRKWTTLEGGSKECPHLRFLGYTAHVLQPGFFVCLFGMQRVDLYGFEAKVALREWWDDEEAVKSYPV